MKPECGEGDWNVSALSYWNRYRFGFRIQGGENTSGRSDVLCGEGGQGKNDMGGNIEGDIYQWYDMELRSIRSDNETRV